MRELVTFTYCDICKASGERVEADESLSIRLTFGSRAKRLDVCTEHKDPLWSQITEHAVNDLDEPSPTAPNVPCQHCDKRVMSSQGLISHYRRAHSEIPLGEVQRIAGVRVTDRNANRYPVPSKARPGEYECDRCARTFDSAQGLTMHKVRAGHR